MNQYYKRMIELQPANAILPQDTRVIDLYMSISKIELSQPEKNSPTTILKKTESEEELVRRQAERVAARRDPDRFWNRSSFIKTTENRVVTNPSKTSSSDQKTLLSVTRLPSHYTKLHQMNSPLLKQPSSKEGLTRLQQRASKPSLEITRPVLSGRRDKQESNLNRNADLSCLLVQDV